MKRLKKAKNGTTTTQTTTPPKPKTPMFGDAEKRAAAQKKREENIRKRDSILNRTAAAKGMTRAEYKEWSNENAKKPDVPSTDQSGVKGANKRTRDRGTCNTNTTIRGESLRDFKRGGVIKKTGKLIPKKSSVSKKLGSAKKTIGNMIFKSKKK